MLLHSRAIVLRTTKYGDTSLIADVVIEGYGRMPLMIKGARKANKAGSSKASIVQAGFMLHVSLSYVAQKQFQLPKDLQLDAACVQSCSMPQLACITFCTELLDRILVSNELNDEFFEHAWLSLQKCYAGTDLIYQPILFTLECATLLGFEITGSYSAITPHLHLSNGRFELGLPSSTEFVANEAAQLISDAVNNSSKLSDNNYARQHRHDALMALLKFLELHLSKPLQLRSIDVWGSVL
ncbi:MAG: repair protein RecO [Bacteroidota bacterium]|jgi:DNA repair protein RecO (recombination protein O)